MPPFVVPDPPGDNAYSQPQRGWRWHEASRFDMVDEGWKLHVSGSGAQAQTILDLVLPLVSGFGTPHKFLPTTEDLQQQNTDNQQRGKFIAIYPGSVMAAFILVSEIDGALGGAGIARAQHPGVAGDLAVGNTLVYARYGSFQLGAIWNPTTNKFQGDIPGAGPAHPFWVADPWPRYQGPHTPYTAYKDLPGYTKHSDKEDYTKALRKIWR